MTRREVREQVFCMLFSSDFFSPEDMPQQVQNYMIKLEEQKEKDKEYMQIKVNAIMEKLPEIDDMINQVAKGWKTSRMAKVDVTLLRLATYEIKFEDSIPDGVAINEAVELAKKYGTEESASFINGVLAKLV